jgi:hypothetical protein
VIVHAPGDEAAARELSVRLAAQRPLTTVIGDGCERLRLGAHISLIIVWSQAAAAQGANGALGEVCFHHDGPVLLCLTDDAPLPEELDDTAYRWIDPSFDEEALRGVKRVHDLITSGARERRIANLTEGARRQRLPVGRAFGGGALAGLATSVALLGAAGATAISAADQMSQEDAAARNSEAARAHAAGRFLQGIPRAPKHEVWMDLRPTAPPAAELQATAETLEEAGVRLAAFHNATEGGRVRIERIAGQTWSMPPAFGSANPAAAPLRAPTPAPDPSRDALIAQIRSHPLAAAGAQPVALASARATVERTGLNPSASDEPRSIERAANDGEGVAPARLRVEPATFEVEGPDVSVELALDLHDPWLPRTDFAALSPNQGMGVAMDEAAYEPSADEGESSF